MVLQRSTSCCGWGCEIQLHAAFPCMRWAKQPERMQRGLASQACLLLRLWLAQAFEDSEGGRLVMLHVGQLGKNETDSNANNNPTCFYGEATDT